MGLESSKLVSIKLKSWNSWQTFVNETRIPELIYITLKHGDQVRFGYGSEEFSISRVSFFFVFLFIF